jgi:hypothetical protein
MANNCYFNITAKGKSENLIKFLDYFIFSDDNKGENDKYLARTFLDWKNKEKFIEEFKEDIEMGEVSFYGDCAWSCYSCWIEGYPNDNNSVQIQDLCWKLGITIEVESEESGEGFIEIINCSPNNLLDYECKDFEEVICGECLAIQGSNPNDLYGEECCNCGEMKLRKITIADRIIIKLNEDNFPKGL